MSPLLPLVSLISLFSLSSASASTTLSLTLTLTPTAAAPPLADLWQKLAHLAAASSARAHHLKHPKSNLSATKVALLPGSYGAYTVYLSFGTPPQTLSFILDTGSSLLWLPCSRRYTMDEKPSNITTFNPKSSSSARIVSCRNPKCKWLFPKFPCIGCDKKSTRCKQRCPSYLIGYGSGSTTGSLISDSLVFPDNKTVHNFLLGGSVSSTELPAQTAGIAGFGRGPESLPSQMKLKRFSYCLVSHKFDDKPVSSDLVLGGAASTAAGIKHTPFQKVPASADRSFHEFYYVPLRRITIGGVEIKVPYKYLVPDSVAVGGTVVDSGTTFTSMEKEVFDQVAAEFDKQMGRNYSRSAALEKKSELQRCYQISAADAEAVDLPQMKFHFEGGAEVAVSMSDFFLDKDEGAICLTIVSGGSFEDGYGFGPAIIWGNYQQQDLFVEYDLEKERFGFKNQVCK